MGMYKNILTSKEDFKRFNLFRAAGIVVTEQKKNLPSEAKFRSEHPRIFKPPKSS